MQEGVYNKMQRTGQTALCAGFRSTSGRFVHKISHKHLKQLKQPAYVFSNNYMTCGTPVHT